MEKGPAYEKSPNCVGIPHAPLLYPYLDYPNLEAPRRKIHKKDTAHSPGKDTPKRNWVGKEDVTHSKKEDLHEDYNSRTKVPGLIDLGTLPSTEVEGKCSPYVGDSNNRYRKDELIFEEAVEVE